MIPESELKYLVLRNGYRFNNLPLVAGQIYTSQDFNEVSEQRKVALILGRIIYRGTHEEVKEKRIKLFGPFEEEEIQMDSDEGKKKEKASK